MLGSLCKRLKQSLGPLSGFALGLLSLGLMLGAIGCGPEYKLILVNIPSQADTLYILTRTEVLSSSRKTAESASPKQPTKVNIKQLTEAERATYSYGLALSGEPEVQESGQTRQTTVSVAATKGTQVLRIGDTPPVAMEGRFVDLQISFDTLSAPPRPETGSRNLLSDMFMTSAERFLTTDARQDPLLAVQITGWNFPSDVQAAIDLPSCTTDVPSLAVTTRYLSQSQVQVEVRQSPPNNRSLHTCLIDLIGSAAATKLHIVLSSASRSQTDDWMQEVPPIKGMGLPPM